MSPSEEREACNSNNSPSRFREVHCHLLTPWLTLGSQSVSSPPTGLEGTFRWSNVNLYLRGSTFGGERDLKVKKLAMALEILSTYADVVNFEE